MKKPCKVVAGITENCYLSAQHCNGKIAFSTGAP